MSRYDTFNRILQSLHRAALDDTYWLDTSTLIDEACGVMGNGLVVAERGRDIPRILFSGFYNRGRRRGDLERIYFDDYFPWDERVPRLTGLPDSQLALVKDLYTEVELKTSLTYNEGLPSLTGQKGLNVRLDGPENSDIFWVFADPAEDGEWGSEQFEMIKGLLPHIRQFACVRQVVAGAGALGTTLAELLDNSRIGVIHLNRKGQIVEANDRGRRLLGRADGLFDRGGHLRARLPADNVRLERLLGRALPAVKDGASSSGSMSVRRCPGKPSLVLHVNPVTSTAEMDLGLRRVAATVLVVDPATPSPINPELVAEVLGLTPAESHVAALLAEGKSVPALASETGRQKTAVYWLLQRIYKKLDISRQVDLVRLALSVSKISISRVGGARVHNEAPSGP